MEQFPDMATVARYLVDTSPKDSGEAPVKLPSLGDLAKEMGVSRGKLREELIAAQAYGVVEMRPGDGTYVHPFDFYTAIRPAVLYSLASDRGNFEHFRRLRAYLEVVFWDEATRALDADDVAALMQLVEAAERKLAGRPIEIPDAEHRDLHMRIYARVQNPFVLGLLRAYWDAYESIELHLYFDLSYYQEMWDSHRALVVALEAGNFEEGKRILTDHFSILENRLNTSDI